LAHDAQADAGLAIIAIERIGVFRAFLDTGDVAEADLIAVRSTADDERLEVLRRGEAALYAQREILRARLDAAGGQLDILPAQRQFDVARRQAESGEAIGYCLKQRGRLEAFLLDGRLELDNNRSERSIKPFVIGRKNWLFANTPQGAKASATIYSIVETAKENGLNPFAYLRYLFERLPNIDIHDEGVLDKLLPWSRDLPLECRVNK